MQQLSPVQFASFRFEFECDLRKRPLDPYDELVEYFGQLEDTFGRALFARGEVDPPCAVETGELLEQPAVGRMKLRVDSSSEWKFASGLTMRIANSEHKERARRLLVRSDAALAEELDNFGAPVMASFRANHCSSEIAGLPEAGIASVAPQLAYRCQCLNQVWEVAPVRRVSPACQVAVPSDAVALESGVDRAKVEDEPLGVRYLTWSRLIFGSVETAGLASAVADSPLQHFVRPY